MELRLIINWPYIIEITLDCPGGPHELTKILRSGKATRVRKLSFHCLICPRTYSQYVAKSVLFEYYSSQRNPRTFSYSVSFDYAF